MCQGGGPRTSNFPLPTAAEQQSGHQDTVIVQAGKAGSCSLPPHGPLVWKTRAPAAGTAPRAATYHPEEGPCGQGDVLLDGGQHAEDEADEDDEEAVGREDTAVSSGGQPARPAPTNTGWAWGRGVPHHPCPAGPGPVRPGHATARAQSPPAKEQVHRAGCCRPAVEDQF